MSRIKLLLFALPALALWLADLSLTASSLSDKAVDQAVAYAQRGADAVSVRLAGRRAELQGLALRLGARREPSSPRTRFASASPSSPPSG